MSVACWFAIRRLPSLSGPQYSSDVAGDGPAPANLTTKSEPRRDGTPPPNIDDVIPMLAKVVAPGPPNTSPSGILGRVRSSVGAGGGRVSAPISLPPLNASAPRPSASKPSVPERKPSVPAKEDDSPKAAPLSKAGSISLPAPKAPVVPQTDPEFLGFGISDIWWTIWAPKMLNLRQVIQRHRNDANGRAVVAPIERAALELAPGVLAGLLDRQRLATITEDVQSEVLAAKEEGDMARAVARHDAALHRKKVLARLENEVTIAKLHAVEQLKVQTVCMEHAVAQADHADALTRARVDGLHAQNLAHANDVTRLPNQNTVAWSRQLHLDEGAQARFNSIANSVHETSEAQLFKEIAQSKVDSFLEATRSLAGLPESHPAPLCKNIELPIFGSPEGFFAPLVRWFRSLCSWEYWRYYDQERLGPGIVGNECEDVRTLIPFFGDQYTMLLGYGLCCDAVIYEEMYEMLMDTHIATNSFTDHTLSRLRYDGNRWFTDRFGGFHKVNYEIFTDTINYALVQLQVNNARNISRTRIGTAVPRARWA